MGRRIMLMAAATFAALATAIPHGQTPARPGGSVFLTPFDLHAGARTIPAEEGLLFVPENRAKSGSRNIAVHFIRVRGSQPGRLRSSSFRAVRAASSRARTSSSRATFASSIS